MEVNGAFEKQSGLKDACGKRVREMIPQLEEHWFEIFGQIALTGEPAHFENHAMQLDRWFDVSAFRVGHPRERNVAILFNDITERKRVEAALRRSEAYLAEGQRLSQTGSWALNVSTGDLFWSLEHFRIFGVDSVTTKLTQELFFRTLHPDDHERVKNHFENVVRERSDFESDYRIARPDGTVRSIRAIAHPVLDQSGQVVEYVGTVIDMTERRRAEEALRESEARFRSYFELGLIGMAITSPIKGILEVNDEICRILGYERGELLQKSWAEMTHPDDLASDIAQFNRVLAGEIDGYTVDKRWIRKDRRVIDSIMAAKCLRRADGSVDYFAGLVLDTTTRKQAEMALRKAQEELAHVTRVTTMGELAASIAHEINQPLGAIVNNSNVALRLLNNAMESDGELREILADIVKDSNRASTIIARVRALATRSTPEKTSLHLRDVVVEALALAQGELAERRIAVRTELADNLPLIYADRVQLQQVLLNLVMNASEAMSSMPDDRRVLTICARRDEADGRPTVRMTVSDLGHGFNVENTERLFDAFYTNKPHGMGMGLRISRSIIEAHGGHLWAATNENAGATLTCVLPAAI
jgi:PAS domain S-box-containing protein